MNQKQLANVLIKILGLSLCAHSISYIASGIVNWIRVAFESTYSASRRNFADPWMVLLINLIPFAIGVYLVARSRWLTDKLIKDE